MMLNNELEKRDKKNPAETPGCTEKREDTATLHFAMGERPVCHTVTINMEQLAVELLKLRPLEARLIG